MQSFPPIGRALLALIFGFGLSAGVATAQETPSDEASADDPVLLVNEAFTTERFAALQAEGALILVDVFASWCGTCARQQEILSAFHEAHPGVPLHRLQVDFDDQKKYVRQFRAPRQSTLLLYVGDEQVWFSVAETNSDKVFAAISEAAAKL
jgi:thioredoxin 1